MRSHENVEATSPMTVLDRVLRLEGQIENLIKDVAILKKHVLVGPARASREEER